MPFGREIGGFILTVSGLRNFYFLPHFYDMRLGYKGDVFFFMSKNERRVSMFMYGNHSFNVHTCTFSQGYRFFLMRVNGGG